MKTYDVCVLGGGASGTLCSILLAKKGLKVCVIEKKDKIAKKLLVTGNGKCNITNQNMNSSFFNQNIDKYLNQFGFKDTINLFKSYGLDIYADSEGRCYPISNSAKSVQMVLINQCQKHNVEIMSAVEVLNVLKDKMSFGIELSGSQIIFAKNVVVACGINNFSMNLCKKFDIQVKKILPSLVALKTKQNTKRLDGLRLSNVLVSAKCGNFVKEEIGEVLFKDAGLSGIAIFNISSIFAKNKQFGGKISINLLKNHSKLQIFEMIYEKLHIFEDMQTLLSSIFEMEVAREILKRCDINLDSITINISKNQIEKIVDVITDFEFNVIDCYSNNQVLSGGVKLSCLTKNLESKINKNLYFVGEVCDVDGICGGYNLQWAWTSAVVASNHITKSFSNKN